MLLDIRPDHLRMVLDILQKHVPQYEVWAFGSRAKWTAKDYSDLDLCVVSDKPLSFSLLGALAEDFSESDLPWKVDVVDWATVSESFRKIIKRDKVVVQKGAGMSEWRTYPLAELTINHDGKRKPVKESERRVGPYPYYGASGIVDYVDDYLIDGDYLLIAEDGENLRTRQTPIAFMARGKSWVNNHAHIVTGNNKADTRFLMYALQSADVSAYLTGAVMPKLTQGNLNRIPISCPPLDEQRAIAHILGTLDDKIELNRRMNETLEAIARAMFKSWFVDFDPVRAKMSGEPPESICQRLGLTPDLLALFPDRLVDSELGEIPEGWRVGTIGDHCYLNAESWSAKTIPDVVHYVDLANVKSGIISEVQILPSASAPSRARRILRADDTIIGTVRPGNRSFTLIGEDEPQLTGSTGFAVLSPKRKASREMVFFLATSDENIGRLSRLADGAAYPAVRSEVVTAGACIVPDPSVIDEFHAATASMIDYQIANRISNDTLGAARDTLLPKLLSGELRLIS